MSLSNGSMHFLSVIGAAVLSAAITGPTLWLAHPKNADAGPVLEDMEAIEASLAVKKAPQKQPQKKVEEKAPEIKPDGVSHDETKHVDDKSCKKDADCTNGDVCTKGKCEKPKKVAAKEDTDPLAKFRRTDPDAETGPKTTVDVGSFNDNDRGWAEESKGHPFFQKVARDFVENFEYPKILQGDHSVGCIHMLADGTIQKYKVEPKSGVDTLDDAVERALKKMKQVRAQSPEPVPVELLKQATTRWICFDTGKLQRAE